MQCKFIIFSASGCAILQKHETGHKKKAGRNVLSESFLYLPLWPIFRQSHPNFRGGRNANASEIWAQLTKKIISQNQAQKDSESTLPLVSFQVPHHQKTQFLSS